MEQIYMALHERGLCANRTAFQREWLRRSHSYITKMGEPHAGPLLNLWWKLRRAGLIELAYEVEERMGKMVEEGSV